MDYCRYKKLQSILGTVSLEEGVLPYMTLQDSDGHSTKQLDTKSHIIESSKLKSNSPFIGGL